jgi:uncharacterized protein
MSDTDETLEGERSSVAASGRVGPRAMGGKKVVAGVAVAALLVGGAGLGLALDDSGGSTTHTVTCSGTTPKLTVQGTGQASATPDVLTAVVQVTSTAGSATAALSQNNSKVTATVLAFYEGGVPKRDIQTTGLTLQPQYSYPKGVQTLSGYQVINTVTATLHDVAKAGAAIDEVVEAAGNAAQINSLTFSFNNPDKVEDVARGDAVRQAVSHAKAMAAAAGRKLGPVCSLTDNTQTSEFPTPLGGFTSAASGSGDLAAAAPPVPIESGSQSETDQVTVVYALG